MVSPHTQGSFVPGVRGDLPPSPRLHSALGLAHERWNLNVAGLPVQVIDTHSLHSGKCAFLRSGGLEVHHSFSLYCG